MQRSELCVGLSFNIYPTSYTISVKKWLNSRPVSDRVLLIWQPNATLILQVSIEVIFCEWWMAICSPTSFFIILFSCLMSFWRCIVFGAWLHSHRMQLSQSDVKLHRSSYMAITLVSINYSDSTNWLLCVRVLRRTGCLLLWRQGS